MAKELLPQLDPQAVLEGHMTPIWFGSAINSFGVKELMERHRPIWPRAAASGG